MSSVPDHQVHGPAGAPVLVLGNSLGTTSEVWGPQLPALTARFRVVTTELPGHGGRRHDGRPLTIDDLGRSLLALLDHLDVGRASLAGISLGGMVSMWVAAHAPERVDRLVLCSTAARLPPASSWTERAAAVRAEGAMALLPTLLDRWLTPAAPSAQRELVTGMLATVDDSGYAACCEAIGAMDLRPDLARITAPALVIGGALDPVCPAPTTLDLHTAIAGSELVIVPGAAHLANVEQAERVTTAIVHHLAGLPAGRGMAVRREVLGDAHVDRAVAATSPFTAPFQDLVARLAWGEVWTRPGLDRRTRSCVTLAMLVALGRFEELAMHVRGARRNGLTPDEIGEVLLQTAVYCGVPAANRAFAEAARVLDEETGPTADRPPPTLGAMTDSAAAPPPESEGPSYRSDPAYTLGEREMLESWLEYHRDTLRWKIEGLDDEQAKRQSVPPSTMSLLGLVRHMADVELNWFRRVLAGGREPGLFWSDEKPEGQFEDLDDAVVADDIATWQAEIEAARAIAATRSLDDTGIRRGQPCSLRWVYLHMIEEYARHNGHADLLRECIDGATGD